MKIPNSQNAAIPILKIKGYLLSETHSVGRTKAKFLRQNGFNETNVKDLQNALLTIAQQNVIEIINTIYGKKYVVIGEINAPDNTVIKLKTIWLIEHEEENPRFITAYPT